MGFDTVNQRLQTSGNPGAKFEDVGDSHTGTLLDVDMQVMTDPQKNNEVKYRKDGVTPQEQIVLTLQTEERDPKLVGDTGVRKVYCSWRMERSLKDAYKAAGAEGLEPNAKVTITRGKDETVKGPVGNVKAKTYTVVYERPLLGGSEGWAAEGPTDGGYDETASEPEPSEANIKNALALWNNGKGAAVDVIAQATGISVKYLTEEVFA